jgi:hypothetical protein
MTKRLRFLGLMKTAAEFAGWRPRAGLFYPLAPGGASTGDTPTREDFAAIEDRAGIKDMLERESRPIFSRRGIML